MFDNLSASAPRLAATKKTQKLGELELAACKILGSGCRDVVRVWARESTMHRARVSVRRSPGLHGSARRRVTRAAPDPGKKPAEGSPGGRAPAADRGGAGRVRLQSLGAAPLVTIWCAWSVGARAARTSYVPGQPRRCILDRRRWAASTTRRSRCSRSRCRRWLGASQCLIAPVACAWAASATRRAARRRATHGSEAARPAPACGTRRAPGREHIIAATGGAHAARERAQASRARGNRGGTQTRRERDGEHAITP